jgi:hypothetical protein
MRTMGTTRTTVTLEPDVEKALRDLMRERGVSFKEAVNTALRAGLMATRQATTPYRTPSRQLVLRPGIDLDKALTLSSQLEDLEILRKLAVRK